MKSLLLGITLLITSLGLSQECLNIGYKLRGYFYAGSAIKDTLSPGGFANSPNVPRDLIITPQNESKRKVLQLVVRQEPAVFAGKYKGFIVTLRNTTNETISLSAQDSRLNIKRQVFYQGAWQDIEYLPSSWCGNSYHQVYIKPNQYWEFEAPCLEGKIEAKFRFELYVNENLTIHSNEFDGSFNTAQLKKEQGHTPTNIMDPYEN